MGVIYTTGPVSIHTYTHTHIHTYTHIHILEEVAKG